MLYAVSTSEQGATPKALPIVSPAPTTVNWMNYDMNGNRNSLWLLITGNYVTPDTFICPDAGTIPARVSDGFFGKNTCSYSYISMVNPTSNTRPPIGMTDRNAVAGLVILGDLNPRFQLNTAPPFLLNSYNNSLMHSGGEGQNIGCVDGSATWNSTGIVTTGTNVNDLIYAPVAGGDITRGTAGAIDDVFLLP